MKKFFLYCGYDILMMGADRKNREVELEVNWLEAKPIPKVFKFSGKLHSLNTDILDMCLEEESADYLDFLERTHTELKRVGDHIEYTFNDSKEGEINFFLTTYFLPRYDRLIIKDDSNQTEYSFKYKDVVTEDQIHTRDWKLNESYLVN